MEQQPKRPRPVLYYSRYCQFCKDLGSQLQRANVSSVFDAFCVDGRMHALPAEVRAVPTIQLLDRFYVDDELEFFVATIKQDLNASPYDSYSINEKTLSSFSFVDGVAGAAENLNAGFMPVQQMSLNSTLPAIPTDMDVGTSKLTDMQMDAVEQYRDSELQPILEQQQPAGATAQ